MRSDWEMPRWWTLRTMLVVAVGVLVGSIWSVVIVGRLMFLASLIYGRSSLERGNALVRERGFQGL